MSLAGLFLLIGAAVEQTLDEANKIVEETFGSDLRTFTGMVLADATMREVTDSGGGKQAISGPNSGISMEFFNLGTHTATAPEILEAGRDEIEFGFKPSYAAGPPPGITVF